MEWYLYKDQGNPFQPENYISLSGMPTEFKTGRRIYAIRARANGLYPDITEELKEAIFNALEEKRSTEIVKLKP